MAGRYGRSRRSGGGFPDWAPANSFIYKDAQGKWAALIPGPAGRFIQSSGGSSPPVWAVPAGGGSGGHTIQDEGTPLTARNNLNFIGAGVVATDDSVNDRTNVTIAGYSQFGSSGPGHAAGLVPDPGAVAGTTKFLREDGSWIVPSGGSGHTIQDETTSLTSRTNLNFTGAGVTATDNSGTNSSDVTIPGYYHTVQENGTDRTQRHKINFIPAANQNVTATDDSTNDRTTVQIAQNIMVGSGASHAPGLVPDPGATAGTANFLREDGSWAAPPSGGGSNGFTQPPSVSGATWLNQGTATASNLTSGIKINHPGGSGNNLRAVILEAAASPTWTRYFMVAPVNTTGWYGFVIYSSGSGQMLTCGINCNGTTSIEIKCQRWTSFTVVNTTRFTETIFGPWPLWFRVGDNASNMPFDVSRDGGQTWRNILNDASNWFTSAYTSFAFGADNNGIGSATSGVLRSYSSTAPDPTIVQ